MNTLITGGVGFIGFALARTLAASGWSVTLVDRPGQADQDHELATFLESGPHRLIQCDLLDPRALDAVAGTFDVVWHLAAILGVAAVRRDPMAVLRDNVQMQLHVMAFARRQVGLKRFVFTSTSEVYAGTLTHYGLPFPTPESTPLTVSDLGEPRTSYMLSKIYGEALLHQAGLPFAIVRPHNVYGPRMGTRHVVPQLIQRILATPDGGALEVFSPEHRRTFCFVQDAVAMMCGILANQPTLGATLNIGTEQPEVTMRELAARLAQLMGRDIRIVDGPVTPGSPVRRAPSLNQTAALTGVTPKVSLDEGLSQTYEWYRAYLSSTGEERAQ